MTSKNKTIGSRKCVTCGMIIVNPIRDGRFCCNKCADVYYGRNSMKMVTCKTCGVEFPTKQGAKYCTRECRIKGFNALDLERARLKKLENEIDPQVEKEAKPRLSVQQREMRGIHRVVLAAWQRTDDADVRLMLEARNPDVDFRSINHGPSTALRFAQDCAQDLGREVSYDLE